VPLRSSRQPHPQTPKRASWRGFLNVPWVSMASVCYCQPFRRVDSPACRVVCLGETHKPASTGRDGDTPSPWSFVCVSQPLCVDSQERMATNGEGGERGADSGEAEAVERGRPPQGEDVFPPPLSIPSPSRHGVSAQHEHHRVLPLSAE
jgi:hypothetical protein